MKWRRVLEEYEADLYKVPTPRFFRVERGELEIKRYEDGEARLEIVFFGVRVADGSTVAVVIDGQFVCDVVVKRRRGRLELSTAKGEPVPRVRNGSVGEIQYNGEPLLRGVFEPD